MRACGRAVPGGVAAIALALLLPGALGAQSITGRVVDAESRQPVPGAEVRLLDSAAAVVARELSNAAGAFAFGDLRSGRYTIEVEQFGYEPRRTRTLEVDEDGIHGHEVAIEPLAIPLEEIRVTSRLRRMRHEGTYAGLYARHTASPSVGNNRVILRTDPEFEGATSVRDLLYHFTPAQCAPYVIWRGFLSGRAVRDSPASSYLDLSVAHLEAIEYYRDYASLPMSYRAELDAGFRGNVPLSAVRRCGVVALWPRRP